MDRADLLLAITHDFADIDKYMRRSAGRKSGSLSPALDATLLHIGHHAAINVKALASLLGITSGAVTQHVLALAERGFIKRTPNPADRRITTVTLTDIGRIAYQKQSREKISTLIDVFHLLDESELDELARVIHKIKVGLPHRSANR